MGQATKDLMLLLSILMTASALHENETDIACNTTYTTATGIRCFECPPGYYKSGDCVANGTQSSCVQCDVGTYQPYCNVASSCIKCTSNCLPKMTVKSQCTPTSDLDCICEHGTFQDIKSAQCLRHRICESGTGVSKLGTAIQDTICEPCEPGISFSDSISNKTCSLCSVCDTYKTECTVHRDAVCGNISLVIIWVSLILAGLTLLAVLLSCCCVMCKANEHRSGLSCSSVVCCRKRSDKRCVPKLTEWRKFDDLNNLYDRRRRFQKNIIRSQQLFTSKCPTSPDRLKRQPVDMMNIKRIGRSEECRINVEIEQSGNFSNQSSENKLPEILLDLSRHLTPESFTAQDGKHVRGNSTRIVKQNSSNESPQSKDDVSPALADVQGNKLSNTDTASNVAIIKPVQIQEFFNKDEAAVHDINRQADNLVSAGDENKNEAKDSEDSIEIDWIKVFKDLVPNLPQDESWKIFAIELLHFCQKKYGKPLKIYNKIKEIDNNTSRKSKGVSLAYHEVLNTWQNIMAKNAVFEQIEQALQRFEDTTIMEAFEKIKIDPLSRNHYINKKDMTVVPWKPPTARVIQPSNVLTYALYERTHESSNAFTAESQSQQQYLQVSSEPFESEQCLPGPSRLADSTRRYNRLSSNQTRGHSRKNIKKQHHRVKFKVEKKLRARKKLRKLKYEHITLIKKMLAHDEVPLDRQEYDKILKHTTDVISKHTHVDREIMSALTFESYCEMSQNQTRERYVLYSGIPKLMLDQNQFQCLKFYVENARRRVIKALNEVNEHADSTYLFITYDGKSLLNDFQRRGQTLKIRLASTSSSDTSVIDESDIMSQSDSQISDYEELEKGYAHNLETSASTTQRAICSGESTFNRRMATESESFVNGISTSIPQSGLMSKNMLKAPDTLKIIEEEDITSVDIEDSLKGLCESKDCKLKRLDVPEKSNELTEQKMDGAQTYASV